MLAVFHRRSVVHTSKCLASPTTSRKRLVAPAGKSRMWKTDPLGMVVIQEFDKTRRGRPDCQIPGVLGTMNFLNRFLMRNETLHQQLNPPSTTRSIPVTKLAADEARNTAGPTISSAVAIRCIGVSRSNIPS